MEATAAETAVEVALMVAVKLARLAARSLARAAEGMAEGVAAERVVAAGVAGMGTRCRRVLRDRPTRRPHFAGRA